MCVCTTTFASKHALEILVAPLDISPFCDDTIITRLCGCVHKLKPLHDLCRRLRTMYSSYIVCSVQGFLIIAYQHGFILNILYMYCLTRACVGDKEPIESRFQYVCLIPRDYNYGIYIHVGVCRQYTHAPVVTDVSY